LTQIGIPLYLEYFLTMFKFLKNSGMEKKMNKKEEKDGRKEGSKKGRKED